MKNTFSVMLYSPMFKFSFNIVFGCIANKSADILIIYKILRFEICISMERLFLVLRLLKYAVEHCYRQVNLKGFLSSLILFPLFQPSINASAERHDTRSCSFSRVK